MACNDCLTCHWIDHIAAVTDGDAGSASGAKTDNIDLDAGSGSSFGSIYGIILKVFGIGEQNNGLAHIVGGCKRIHRHLEGCANSCTLGRNHVGGDGVDKHLGRNVVGGDWKLGIGVSGKDDEAYLVVVHLVDKFLEDEFCALQTAYTSLVVGRGGEHGVGYVHAYHHFNTARGLGLGCVSVKA